MHNVDTGTNTSVIQYCSTILNIRRVPMGRGVGQHKSAVVLLNLPPSSEYEVRQACAQCCRRHVWERGTKRRSSGRMALIL